MKRLGIIVPVALGLISDALYVARFYKKRVAYFVNVPLALIGGILGLFSQENTYRYRHRSDLSLFRYCCAEWSCLVTCINQLGGRL